MWNSHAERTRGALWVMYTRLTSTRLHKFYTLTLLLTLLPLLILHLLALSNTTTALTKLSLLLASTNSTSANSLVPTVTQQDGQGILRLCNVGQSDCQTVTSVAPTATMTSTPQQVGAGGGGGGTSAVTTAPVNAGVAPTSSTTPDVAVQPVGARPASPTSSSPSSSPSPGASPSDGGVLIAAPPAQTTTSSNFADALPSSSSTSTGVFIADAPRATFTTSASGKSGGNDNNSGLGKVNGNNNGKGNGDEQATTTETSSPTELTLSPLITLPNPVLSTGEGTTSSEISSATTTDAVKSSSSDTTTTAVETTSSTSTTSAEPEVETEIETKSPADSTTSESVSTAAASSTGSEESSTSSNDSFTLTISTSTPSIATEPLSSTQTRSPSKETESASALAVGKDVSVNEATFSSTATAALPSLVHPEFESSESGASGVLSSVEPTGVQSAVISSSTSTTSPTSTVPLPTSTLSPTSSSSAVEETKDTREEEVRTAPKEEVTTDTLESSSTGRTKDSSSPTAPTSSGSESTESTEVPAQATNTKEQAVKPSTSDALDTPRPDIGELYKPPSNARFFSSRHHLSVRAFSATPITNSTTGALAGIDVTDVGDTGGQEITRLGIVCAIAMAFPRDQLQQHWMENLTMAAFYLGMLGVGIVAILNESVAHLITISISTLLSLLWTGTQLVRTHYIHDQFDAFITRGACSGIDVLPHYWAQRTRLELPILIINALALLLLGILGVQLFKRYHREGRREVERYVYKVIVVLRCAILLGGFLLSASLGIWVHLLFTNAGVVGTSGVDMLKALGIVSLVFVAPWAVLGWRALNAAASTTAGAPEGRWWGKRTMIGFFCGLNVLFLGGWIVTFASDIYRAVFLAWTFFAVLSIAGFFVFMGSLGAGVVCWMRFARDLQDFDSEKSTGDIPRPSNIASIDPFRVDNSGHSHSHVHGGVGVGLSVPEPLRWDYSNTAEKAWEPFDEASIRQSQFTASEGRQSTAFSYGLRSPAPPMPTLPQYRSSNNSNVSLGLAL